MTPTILYIILGLVTLVGIAFGLLFHEKAKNQTLIRKIGIDEARASLAEIERKTNEAKAVYDKAITDYNDKYHNGDGKGGPTQ